MRNLFLGQARRLFDFFFFILHKRYEFICTYVYVCVHACARACV